MRGVAGQHTRYGSVHKKLRKRWAPQVAAGRVACWRCGKAIAPGAKWDLGHIDDGGPRHGDRHPEHRGCNRATVTHLKQRARGEDATGPGRFGGLPDPTPGDTVDRWSRHWSGPFNPRCPDCRRTGEPCEAARRFMAEEAA